MTDIKKTLKSQGLMPASVKAQEMHFVGFLSACVVLAAVILSLENSFKFFNLFKVSFNSSLKFCTNIQNWSQLGNRFSI